MQEMDEKEEMQTVSSESEEEENLEDIEEQYRLQKAVLEKERVSLLLYNPYFWNNSCPLINSPPLTKLFEIIASL